MRPMLANASRALAVVSLLLAGCGVSPDGLSTFSGTDAQSFGALSTGASNGLTLFTEPEDGVAPVVNALASARQSIRMEMYLLSDPSVISGLTTAARRGVDVRVLLEQNPYGATAANQSSFNALQSGGVKVNWSNPQFTYTHEKGIVIDGTTSIISTTNMTNGAFSNNREYGLIDTNPAEAQALSAIFDADWVRQTPSYSDPNLVVSPDDSRAKLTALIDSARQSLTIEDEEANDPAILAALGAKARAGVNVTVEIAGGTGAAAAVSAIQAAGVRNVKVLNGLYLHAKLIIADGTTAYIGSVNLSSTSMDKNREVGLIFTNPAIIQQLQQTAATDWSNGQ